MENNTVKKQSEIVKDRLFYHFKTVSGEWDYPANMPFMKEFLNEVAKLCNMVNEQR